MFSYCSRPIMRQPFCCVVLNTHSSPYASSFIPGKAANTAQVGLPMSLPEVPLACHGASDSCHCIFPCVMVTSSLNAWPRGHILPPFGAVNFHLQKSSFQTTCTTPLVLPTGQPTSAPWNEKLSWLVAGTCPLNAGGLHTLLTSQCGNLGVPSASTSGFGIRFDLPLQIPCPVLPALSWICNILAGDMCVASLLTHFTLESPFECKGEPRLDILF